jgi:hypothetical protein
MLCHYAEYHNAERRVLFNIRLNVNYTERRYAECRFAECRSAHIPNPKLLLSTLTNFLPLTQEMLKL